jgi:predicted dehydrogenase
LFGTRRTTVTERIRWAIAGTGVIASAFATDLALVPDAELVAVGSRSRESADAFGDRFGAARRHVGYAELAADPEVDAVYVAVPHTGHCDVTLSMIAGGKAVLCEKPFAINAAETARMVDAAREAGVFLMEAMWVRFLPHLVRLREVIAQGLIGQIRSVIVDRGDVLSAEPTHRVLDPALGGGVLLDLGIYPVSFISMLLGAPKTVAAISSPAVTGVDAQTSGVFGFEDGAHALFTTSLLTRTANAASITGTLGRIDLPDRWAHTGPFTLSLLDGSVERFEFEDEGNGLRHQAVEVGRQLRAGQTESPVLPLDETLAVMRTLDAIREQIGLVYPGE